MNRFVNLGRRANVLGALAALAMAVSWAAAAAAPRLDESQLSALGFKVLVATTKVQQDWVRTLPSGPVQGDATQREEVLRVSRMRPGARCTSVGPRNTTRT